MIVLLCIYNFFNMYTDIRWRITKNVWHLLYLIAFLSYSIVNVPDHTLWIIFFNLGIPLAYGLLLENVGTTGAGDTKMMIVNATGLSSIIISQTSLLTESELNFILFLFLFSLSVVLLFVDGYRIAKKHGFKYLINIFRKNFVGTLLIKFGFSYLAKLEISDAKDFKPLAGAVLIFIAVFVTYVAKILI